MMDLSEAITVTKLAVQYTGESCYLMIGWHVDSFEVYLFNEDKLWKGRFSPNRLAGFSRNLHLSEVEYFTNIKKCLSEKRDDYIYELKSGFFYWKRKLENGSLIIEGFLPMELDTAPRDTQPDLIEVLLALNVHLKEQINGLKDKFKVVTCDYQKCLKDTEEFLGLKIDMEKALCSKFLSLLNAKKSTVTALQLNQVLLKENRELEETAEK